MNRLLSRKEFLKSLGLGAASILCAGSGYGFLSNHEKGSDDIRGQVFRGDGPRKPWKWAVEGYFYETNGDCVQCQICPHHCELAPGDRSICRSKVNIGGKLYSLTYGNPSAIHVDPIEKKPLNHFYPRSLILSIATTGCNFRCLNCQNWELSQKRPEDVRHGELFPEQVVKEAQKKKTPAIAYTYAEPITFYEYMFDTAKCARTAGLKNVLISNGYINPEPLRDLCKFLDGANVNLKSFDDTVYRGLNGGTLSPVLNTFKLMHAQGVWFEMTTLVVPNYVDDPEMIKRMCEWILKELGPDYPLHFLRFFPNYRLNLIPATPIETLERLRELALEVGIRYVYLGNVPGHAGAHTYCHNCKKILIKRNGYAIDQYHLIKNQCRFCGSVIPGRWT